MLDIVIRRSTLALKCWTVVTKPRQMNWILQISRIISETSPFRLCNDFVISVCLWKLAKWRRRTIYIKFTKSIWPSGGSDLHAFTKQFISKLYLTLYKYAPQGDDCDERSEEKSITWRKPDVWIHCTHPQDASKQYVWVCLYWFKLYLHRHLNLHDHLFNRKHCFV